MYIINNVGVNNADVCEHVGSRHMIALCACQYQVKSAVVHGLSFMVLL